MRRIVVIALILLSSTESFGACQGVSPSLIVASPYDDADVQDCITEAVDGDTINIPACTVTWGTPVSIADKNINIIGAGIGSTNITTTTNSAFSVVNETKSSFRLSGMSLDGTPSAAWGWILISTYNQSTASAVSGWRVDNFDFDFGSDTGSAVVVLGVNWGLIDNNLFQTTNSTSSELFFIVSYSYYYEADTTYKGDYSWSLPIEWGTEKALYIEDNTFSAPSLTGGAHPFDAGGGARIVYRYNTSTGGGPLFHPTKTGELGAVKYEVYNNTFNAGSYTGYYLFTVQGGGTGVVYNNTWPGGFLSPGLNLMERRVSTSESVSPLNSCDGLQSHDGNLEGGWPCFSQVGRGPGQVSMPVYAWDNGTESTCASGGTCTNTWNLLATGAGISDYIKATAHGNDDVDFVNNGNIAKDGYTPYTYPHPLRLAYHLIGNGIQF